ncbi:hemerythrin domain-containing protein, partial [Candidatus Blastococcus massiliensis]|uniref:hemerythrin domain-containing protein n=1 Tax=Candidatus Blastococcus massiliensis TaxID=1470358 RepID=UPI0009DE104B
MTTATVFTVVPVPRAPADDVVVPGAPRTAPGSRASSYQRVLHQLARRELRLLAELGAWAPPGDRARIAALTGHADLVSRLLVSHHRIEAEALWPALLSAAPARSEADVRAAVVEWTARAARIGLLLRDLATAGRQWAVTGTPAARDAVTRACRVLADAVDAHTAAEERDLLPLLDAHLDAATWSAIAASASCPLTRRERSLVLGL